MNRPANHFYEFDQFRIDVTERLLLQDGIPLALPPKAFDILLTLVQQSGHVLEKRELIETVARRGYRFLTPVRQVRDEGPDLIVENRTKMRVVVKEEKEEREEEITVRLDKSAVSNLAQRLRGNTAVRYLFVPLILIAAVGSAYWNQTRLRQPRALALAKPVIHSIAVLPFKQVGATAKEDYLGAGIADML